MDYITTKVQPLKSYPTFQFYAKADSKSCSADDVFRICILETLRWTRFRLRDFKDLPQELYTPEPDDFRSYPGDRLSSFSYNNGFQLDVIYIDTIGVWSFRINEPDMGANPGTPNERPAVNGRSFTTEFAFRKQNDHVEIGVRTVCSEPSNTDAPCEVFRPRVVKALAEDSNIRLMHSGWIINGELLEMQSRSDLERTFTILDDTMRSMPVVLIADTKTETQTKKVQPTDIQPLSSSLAADKISISGLPQKSGNFNIVISDDVLPGKHKLPFAEKKEKKNKGKQHQNNKEDASTTVKLPPLDHKGLARTLTGFAIVVFVSERYFDQFANKTHISIDHGDIVVISHNTRVERYTYDEYRYDISGFFRILRNSVVEMPKRELYNYGDILFYSDAKLKEYHTRRHRTDSLEEKCAIYKQELDEMRAQVRELSQQQTDMRQTAETLRILQKKYDALEKKCETKGEAYQKLADESALKEEAYRKSAGLIEFYNNMVSIASRFPTNKNDIGGWIDEYFSDDLVTASRALNELRKYSGSLDVAVLCDGLVYLAEYAKYRRQEIGEDVLELYAQRCHWDIQGCGKEALRMHRDEYTVNIDGVQYLLDQHIKRGIHAEELIRIYFCWDAKCRKVIVGSMLEHLATVKNST